MSRRCTCWLMLMYVQTFFTPAGNFSKFFFVTLGASRLTRNDFLCTLLFSATRCKTGRGLSCDCPSSRKQLVSLFKLKVETSSRHATTCNIPFSGPDGGSSPSPENRQTKIVNVDCDVEFHFETLILSGNRRRLE